MGGVVILGKGYLTISAYNNWVIVEHWPVILASDAE